MFEVERYELREIDLLPAALTRREFGGILILIGAAGGFGWGKGMGKGAGLACGIEKGSFVASCGEIVMEQSAVRVKRVVTAFDCGPRFADTPVLGLYSDGEACSIDAARV